MSVKALAGDLCSVSYNMDDYPIDPPIAVVDTPRPRRLTTLAEARDFVDASMRLGRPPPWRDIYERLLSARSEDEAIEAIGALRELLQLEDMLVPPDLPLEPQHRK